MTTDYNNDGRLPIHEAAFRNFDTLIDRIIDSVISKDVNNEDNVLTDEEKERAYRNNRQRIQELLESVTFDYFRLTPLLAATVGDARDAIDCLVRHGAKVTCRDGDNRSMAAIAILKQNIGLFLYLNQAPYATELDLWNTAITMFSSKSIDEAVAAGRLLEQLTSPLYAETAWPYLAPLRLIEKTIQVFIYAVQNNLQETLITSCLLIFYNLFSIEPNIRSIFAKSAEPARNMIKMPKNNETVSFLFAHIVCHLCDSIDCIRIFIDQNIIDEIQILLLVDTGQVPQTQICKYFEILGKIARCEKRYQTLIQNASAAKIPILDRSIHLLECSDRYLTIAILHFIRDLCSHNEEQQRICALNHELIKHLLEILDSSYRDVQRASVDTLQMIVTQNTISQLTIIQQGGVEQLLNLLSKATLPRLRLSIICTLWSLTGEESSRRQKMSYALGVSSLVEFIGLKSSEQLFPIVDAISELLRRVPTVKENLPCILGRRHCIPPIVRALSQDFEEKLLLKCLTCIEKLCLLPTFRPCRHNQTVFQKANGFNQILLLMRRNHHNEYLRAKAINTLACAIFDHKENKEILSKTTVQQLMKRLSILLNSKNENVRVEAGSALVTLITTDENFFKLAEEMISIDLHHFHNLISSENHTTQCFAAFQLIRVIRLIPKIHAADRIGEALIILIEIISDPRIDDEEKINAAELLGRLAHMPTGFGIHKHTGICEAIIASDGLEHLISLLNSSNTLLHGNAAATIECLVQESPEGQRRLFRQCRLNLHYLDILRNYVVGQTAFRKRIDHLYAAVHRESVHLPAIVNSKQQRRVPLN